MSRVKRTHPDRLKKHFARPEGEISRRELFQRLSPLGKVQLDASRCTGCGLCALECPTGALVVSSGEETDAFQLRFRHGYCLACSQCVAVCPEKCLFVERVLELDKMDQESVLFEGAIIRCSNCGSPIGPKAMIDKLRDRVLAAGQSPPSQFGLCPNCKAEAVFRQMRM